MFKVYLSGNPNPLEINDNNKGKELLDAFKKWQFAEFGKRPTSGMEIDDTEVSRILYINFHQVAAIEFQAKQTLPATMRSAPVVLGEGKAPSFSG